MVNSKCPKQTIGRWALRLWKSLIGCISALNHMPMDSYHGGKPRYRLGLSQMSRHSGDSVLFGAELSPGDLPRVDLIILYLVLPFGFAGPPGYSVD